MIASAAVNELSEKSSRMRHSRDMAGERRAATRHPVRDDVTAEVSGVAVRLIELSLVGAKVEHQERFALAAPQLRVTWQGTAMTLAVRAARSEIVGRDAAGLVYHTGLYFVSLDSDTQGFIASLLQQPETAPADAETVPAAPPPTAKTLAEPESADDTWTRQVYLLRHEADDDLPYAQFRLTP